MIKPLFLLTAVMCLLVTDVAAQAELKYRRSSLHLILMEGETFPNKQIVMDAYAKHPFPDKYNEHNVGIKSFNPNDYQLTEEERAANNTSKSKIGKLASNSVTEGTGGIVNGNAADLPFQINKFLEKNEVAKKMVAKWFNKKPDGSIDLSLIMDRGLYSASAKDLEMANQVASSTDYLFDYELLGNSFIVINKQTFISNEVAAAAVRTAALAEAEAITNAMLKDKAVQAANNVYEKTKEGYTMFTKSWLYQLDWNQEIAEKFKSYFMNDQLDANARKAAWDTTTMFKLKFVGDEVSSALVTFSLKTKRTEEEIIRLAVSRNVDNVYAKLQKKYEVFRPVTPILSKGDNILTAQIGMKEGLESGQTFDILESVKDAKTGAYSYAVIGSVKVSKSAPIWDNRAGAKDEPVLDEAGNPVVTPEYSTFDGGKKAEVGFHYLRLKK
jgi:hypothetical protein